MSEKEDRKVHVFIKTRRDQSSVIWDVWGSSKKHRMLAQFDRRGVFTTDDPVVAKELRERGYKEVPEGEVARPTPLYEPDPLHME